MSIVAVARALSLPFVIGGDWQNTPDALARSGFLGCLSGALVLPRAGTCLPYATGEYREVDYFVVSEGLAHAFSDTRGDLDSQ